MLYRYDLRGGDSPPSSPLSGGRHWSDTGALGGRATFSFADSGLRSETGAAITHSWLRLDPLRRDDGGVYRCRVDFREAPTRNTRIELNLISKKQ